MTFTVFGSPPGLTLTTSGVLTGTPTSAGTFTFNVTATDSAGASDTVSYTLIINPALAITTSTLPSSTLNQPGYNQTIRASGGNGSYTFSLSAGTLPAGLTLSTSGILSGTPSVAGTYTFTVTATDGLGGSASRPYAVTILAQVNPTLTTTASPSRIMASTPSATLIGLDEPAALAFDGSGNLYVINQGNDTVSMFAPGVTTPSATLEPR